jgi:hypothetical protein
MCRSGNREGPRRRRVLPVALALALGCAAGGEDPEEVSQPPARQERSATAPIEPAPATGNAWIIFGADTVRAEVARTPDERARGLMYREDLPAGTGMLFVFPENDIRSFWMQNTYLALDIAFLDPSFRVVDIQQMEPESEDFHRSRAPAMYALEVPQGWFAEQGILVGDQAEVVFGL